MIVEVLFKNFDRLEIKNKGLKKMYAKIYLKNGFLIRPIEINMYDVLSVPFVDEEVMKQLFGYIICEIYIKKKDNENYQIMIKDINGDITVKDCKYDKLSLNK